MTEPRMSQISRIAFAAALVICWAAQTEAAKPKLVVVVSVDQLAQEYLSRFAANFAADGFFRTVEREGALFSNCHHRHAFTYTGPGHSVMLTGAYPRQTGIIGNGWYDAALGRDRYCVECDDVKMVGLPEGSQETAMSPSSLLAETLGDVMKRTSEGQAKVIGLSLKDRAGILMAGRKADAAYWFADRRWVTSTWYMTQLPGYLRACNESRPVDGYAGQTWNLLLPPSAYHIYRPDDYPHENDSFGLGRAFPHKLASASDASFDKQFPCTPFGNDATLHAAELVIEQEKLGQDGVTDLLCLGFSSNDYLGHQYGPYSLEVEDAAYRLDRQLAALVKFLDEHVGRGQWTMAVSADHGVAPIPEFVSELGIKGVRNSLGDLSELTAQIEARIRESIGPPPEGQKYVSMVEDSQVYLTRDRKILPEKHLSTARDAARTVLLEQESIFAAVSADELNVQQVSRPVRDPLQAQLFKTFHPQRSGDVLFVLRPYDMQSRSATTHGSPWDYDTHVPLLWLGVGIGSGSSTAPASPAQIAPTLAKLLGIEPPKDCVEEPLIGLFTEPVVGK